MDNRIKNHFGLAAQLTGHRDVEVDDPGSDPSPFNPVPKSVEAVEKLPTPVCKAWVKSF